MVEILMVECDNPKCGNRGLPEHVDKRKKQLVGPYGWLDLSVYQVGAWNIQVHACQEDCVGPAVSYCLDQARRKDRGE